MRKRSLSVTFDRAAKNEEMLKKFEGVNEVHSELEAEEDDMFDVVAAGWAQDDYDKLTANLRSNVPKKDIKPYKTSLTAVDWEQVAFDSHSSKEVEQVTKALIQKARKFRTLTEMLEDIPSLGAKIVKASLPKKPPSAYNCFFKEKYAFFKEKYQTSGANMLKMIHEEYLALTEKKKKKYEQMAEAAKQTYKVELEKFYRENPHMEVKTTQRKDSGKRTRLLNTNILTPFKMFVNEKRSNGVVGTMAEMRAMWDELENKQRYKYIQQCFQQQSEDRTLKLTKEEQSIVEYASGKPEPVPHNLCDFYLKTQKDHKSKSLPASEWRKDKVAEYKNLPKVRKLELELEHRRAKLDYVHKYQEYISGLPDENMQRVETEHLQSFVDSKLDKDEQRQYRQDTMLNGTYTDVPIAESTTHEVNLKPSKAKKKKAKAVDASPEKKTAAVATVGTPKSNAASNPVKSILKSPPPAPNVEPATGKRKLKELANSSPVVNSPKKPKKVAESDSDRNSDNVDKKPKIVNRKVVPEEPVPPPKTVLKYYRQYHYRGDPGKSKESFEKLPEKRKEAIKKQLREAQKKYCEEVQNFFSKLPADRVEFYLNKMQLAQGKEVVVDGGDNSSDDSADDAPQQGLLKNLSLAKQEPESSSDDSESEEENKTAKKTVAANKSSSDDDDSSSDSE